VQRHVLSLLDALPVLDGNAEPLGRFGLGQAESTSGLGYALGDVPNELVRVETGHPLKVQALADR
jgi:hypothetical protein